MAVMERQNSQGSSIASERIAAVVPVERRQQEPKKVIDVEDAENFEESLRASVECLRAKMTRLMETAPSDPKKMSESEKAQLAELQTGIKQIKDWQKKLKNDLVHARTERRATQAQQKKEAMVILQPKAAPPVRMEELRAMNMVKLDESDLRARYELAQKPKPIIPSGGFTGFRVAPDLKRMDFSHSDPNHPDKLEAWRPEVQNKLAK